MYMATRTIFVASYKFPLLRVLSFQVNGFSISQVILKTVLEVYHSLFENASLADVNNMPLFRPSCKKKGTTLY